MAASATAVVVIVAVMVVTVIVVVVVVVLVVKMVGSISSSSSWRNGIFQQFTYSEYFRKIFLFLYSKKSVLNLCIL